MYNFAGQFITDIVAFMRERLHFTEGAFSTKFDIVNIVQF